MTHFNPAELRDPHGKWARGALTGDDAFRSVSRPSGLSGSERQALNDYGMSWGYRTVNPYLNHNGDVFDRSIMGHRKATPKEEETAKRIMSGLDGAFSKAAPLGQHVVVHRGVSQVDQMFGAPGEHVGGEFNSKSYVSTTTVRGADTGFGYGYSKSGPGMAKLEILVPKGSKMVPGNDFEHELLLPRDSRFKVISDVLDNRGSRRIRLEHLPR